MITLCPSAKNELGKGIFAPEDEANLLAKGCVFARRVPGTLVSGIVTSRRPIAAAVTDMQLDSPRFRNRPTQAPTPPVTAAVR